jgi:hypothetical protein
VDYKLESFPLLEERSDSASTPSHRPRSLPSIPDDLVIKGWQLVATGKNAIIRKAWIVQAGWLRLVCFKLFPPEREAEFIREADAYAVLRHRGVHRSVPAVYWKGVTPKVWWNDDSGTERSRSKNAKKSEGHYYTLVMEYFEDFQRLQWDRLDVTTSIVVGQAIARYLQAKVLHNELNEKNILFVREDRSLRVVIIDFAHATLNAHSDDLGDELLGFFQTVGKFVVWQSSDFVNELG